MPSIIAGRRRGAKLLVPEGMGVRPTLARAREALFSMITSLIGSFDGISVLDAFAGSGALGLEAFSRGACRVDFVECDKNHYGLLQKNIEKLTANESCHAILGRTPGAWNRLPQGIHYNLVMCDPPYAAGLLPETLRALLDRQMLAPQAVVSLEMAPDCEIDIPEQLTIIRTKQYAQCKFLLLRHADTGNEQP